MTERRRCPRLHGGTERGERLVSAEFKREIPSRAAELRLDLYGKIGRGHLRGSRGVTAFGERAFHSALEPLRSLPFKRDRRKDGQPVARKPRPHERVRVPRQKVCGNAVLQPPDAMIKMREVTGKRSFHVIPEPIGRFHTRIILRRAKDFKQSAKNSRAPRQSHFHGDFHHAVRPPLEQVVRAVEFGKRERMRDEWRGIDLPLRDEPHDLAALAAVHAARLEGEVLPVHIGERQHLRRVVQRRDDNDGVGARAPRMPTSPNLQFSSAAAIQKGNTANAVFPFWLPGLN